MPEIKVTDERGVTHVFPDGSTPEMIAKAMKVKYNGSAPAPAPMKKPGFWESYDTLVAPFVTSTPHNLRSLLPGKNGQYDPKAYLHEGETALSNIGAGALGIVLHPVNTIGGILRSSAESAPPVAMAENLMGKKTQAQEMGEQFRKAPLETTEGIIGQTGALAGAGEAAGSVARSLPKVGRSTSEGVGNAVRRFAGTGPKVTAKLVEDMKAANAGGDAYSNVQAKIETARENALKEGNRKYSAVNATLNPIQADPEVMRGAIADATEALKGSHADPTLLKQMVDKLQRGDAFTYEDLQGDYSRLGSALSKGTLPGDEFHSFDVLHEAIGDEMQRIADANGQGPQLKAARDYWRRMKQTFGKPFNATDAASSVLQHGSPDLAQAAANANRVRLLGSFDPDIPAAYRDLQNASTKAKSTGLEPTVPGETRKINTEDIQGRKAKATIVAKAPHVIRGVGYRLGALWPLLDAVRDAVKGEVPSVGGLVGGTVAVAGGAHLLSSLLENPKVVEFLTRPTERDLAQVPPELRGDMSTIAQVAARKGIKVDPRIYAIAGAAAPKKTPGDLLRQSQ